MKRSSTAKVLDHAIALEEFVPFNLGVLVNHVSREMARIYRDSFGIGLTEGRIIITLAHRPNMGGNDLSKVFGVDKAVISRALADLIRKGLVAVSVDPTNARRKILSLTRTGRNINRRAVPMVYAVQHKLMSLLDPESASDLRRLLVTLRRALES